MKPLTLLLVALIAMAQGAQGARRHRPPFSIHSVTVPQTIDLTGQATFTFEIRNRSQDAITLCALQGLRYSTMCLNEDGSGDGTGPGFTIKTVTGSDLDPQTGEIQCVTRDYEPSDFFRLDAGESRLLELVVSINPDCGASVVDVTVTFDSDFDGSQLGIHAWKGTTRVGRYRIPVVAR